MVIENKIRSTEHSDQLDRYSKFAKESHPDYRIAGAYLTPHGDSPSHEMYSSLSYETVCKILDSLAEEVSDERLDATVRTSVEQYADMLRRNILSDSEVHQLSRGIYRKHGQAINLVVQSLDGFQKATFRFLKGLVKDSSELSFGYWGAGRLEDWMVIDPKRWDRSSLQVGVRYRGSNRILYFVFYNDLMGDLDLWLELGPGDEKTRNRLFRMAQKHPTVFRELPDSLEEYTNLYKKTLLTSTEADQSTQSKGQRRIREQWATFLKEDLPAIDSAMRKERWIWKS